MNATRRLFSVFSYTSIHVTAAMTIAAVVLTAAGQYAHTYLKNNEAALLAFTSGLAFWMAALIATGVGLPTNIETRVEEQTCSTSGPRRVLVLAGLALALVTFIASNDNTFNMDNVLAWLLSIAILIYAFWQPEKTGSEWGKTLTGIRDRFEVSISSGLRVSSRLLLFAGIVALGVFFHYHDLDGVPGEMDSDHAEKILDVNDVVHGARPIFFERNTGREPLEFYLIAGLVEAGHPLDAMALKLVTATIGVLVIPASFLMTREMMNESVAFFAATLIAVGKWPITIARMGLRFPFTPVFIAPMIYFLLRAVKYQRRNDFLMAGVFLGAGLYGYNAFRMAPVLAAAFLVVWPFIGGKLDRHQWKPYLINSALVFVLALVIFMPLLRYSLDHPENFWYRVLTRLSSEERPLSGNPVTTLAHNAVNAGLMFNWTGDDAWPNSIPGDPALDYISGGLFLLGIAFSLYRLVRFRERAYAFLLIGLAIMLLPTALSLAFPNENPSNARAGGAVPFVFAVTALPLAWIVQGLGHQWIRARAIVLSLLTLGLIAGVNYVRYFRDFRESYLQSSWNSSEVAESIKSFAESVGDYEHAWIMLYPHWIDTRNVAINMGQIGWDHTLPNTDAAEAQVPDGANRLFIVNPNDSVNLSRLQELFPKGQLRVFHSRTPGHDFDLWYVPGTTASDTPLESGQTP